MIKRIFKTASFITSLALAINILTPSAIASLSKEQIHAKIQQFFLAKGLTNLVYLQETPDLTVVQVTSPAGPMTVTFFGDNREYFIQDTPYKIDSTNKSFVKLGDIFIKDYLASQESKLAVYKAPNEKGKIYVVVNINCPHCHHFLDNYKQLVDQGYTLVVAPFVNPSVNNEALKTSYIFNQPANQRFELLRKNPSDLPEAKEVNPYVLEVTDKLISYGIRSYPIFISQSGESSSGWANADKVLKDLKLK